MRLAVLQPAGSEVARQHFRDTIESPVRLADYAELLHGEADALRARHGTERVALWGATPGRSGVNLSSYGRISPGDHVFFAGDKRLFAGGTVTHVFRNRDLALALWGTDHKNQTWELMFALDEVRAYDVPYSELNRVVGYKETNIVQGFTVLDSSRSGALFEYLALDSDLHPASPSTSELQSLLERLPNGTEQEVSTVRRLEQGLLRRTLLPNGEGKCALCGEVFPAQFLVAAHIKRRSVCTEDERLTIPWIAMLACKFGCDALFEMGYVGVAATGTVVVSPLAPRSGSSAANLARLDGAACGAFGPERAPYFAWHLAHTFKAGRSGS